MEVRAFGIHSIRGVLASGGVFGGELLVDERTANRRVWQLADDARAAGVKVQKNRQTAFGCVVQRRESSGCCFCIISRNCIHRADDGVCTSG